MTTRDIVFCDEDGVAFVGADRVEEVLSTARSIWQIERRQARRIRNGEDSSRPDGFRRVSRPAPSDSAYTFRAHLRAVRGAIEQ